MFEHSDDSRLIALVDSARAAGLLPANFRIPQFPGAAWQAVETLQGLGRSQVPPVVNLTLLESEMKDSIGRFSFAFHTPPTRRCAALVVSKVSALLRANPLPWGSDFSEDVQERIAGKHVRRTRHDHR
jgi:hypothetical protein